MTLADSASTDRRRLIQSGLAFLLGANMAARPLAARRAMAAVTPVASPGASPATGGDGGWGEFIKGTTPGAPNAPGGWATTMPKLPDGLPANPPITVTVSKQVGATTKFFNGDTIENSPFTRMASKYLGIDWKIKFQYANSDDARTKMNTAIASGDLPDVMEQLDLTTYVTMLEANLLEDITDAWASGASDKFMNEPMKFGGEGRAWAFAEVDGKKMAIPAVASASQDDKVMWIRQDWLDKVGMKVPTNLDELKAVAKAFVDAKLGANGQTVGIGVCRDLNTWYGSADPIFGAFGVIPGGNGSWWTKEGEGLTYEGIRPAQKKALQYMADLYKEGLIPTDFYTMDASKVEELVAGNSCGLHFSPAFAAGYGIADSIANDPKAVWTVADIPAGPDGTRKKAWSNPYPEFVYAFRKGFEHAEEVIKQSAWVAELVEVPENRMLGWQDYNFTINDKQEYEVTYDSPAKWFCGPWGGDPGVGYDPLRTKKRQDWEESLKNKPVESLNAYEKWVVGNQSPVTDLSHKAYAMLLEKSEAEGIKNEYLGLPTEGMKQSGQTLSQMEQEQLLGIIKGDYPVDQFDQLVESWKSSGGDQITKEVNDWWAAHKK